MKSSSKIVSVVLLLGFCSSQGMKIQKTLKKSHGNNLIKRQYVTNPQLAQHYLTSGWLFENTDEETIKEASENLTKYGASLYAECNSSEKKSIKKLLKHNSVIAQEKLKELHDMRFWQFFSAGMTVIGSIAAFSHIHRDPLLLYLFTLNSSLALFSGYSFKNTSEEIKAYRGIVAIEEYIEHYDATQLQEGKDQKDNN